MIAGALDVLKDEGESRTPNRLLRGWMPFPPNQAEPGRSRNPIGHERHHGLQPSRPGEASVQTAFTLWRFHRDGQRPDRPDVNYWVITTNVSDLTKRLVDDLIFTPAQDIPSGNFVSTEMLDETRRKAHHRHWMKCRPEQQGSPATTTTRRRHKSTETLAH